jgi:hypothetical protein
VKGQPRAVSSTEGLVQMVFHAQAPLLTPRTPSQATLNTLLSKGAADICPAGVQSKGA